MKVFLVSANTATTPYPTYPLGMGMVAAALQRAGHEASQFDFLHQGSDTTRLAAALRAFDPGLVGVSIRNVDSTNIFNDKSFLDAVRTLVGVIRGATPAPVVLGGAGFSIMPEAILDYTGADFGTVGEGERLVVELVDGIARGDRPARILRTTSALPGPGIPSALYDPELLRFYMDNGSIVPIQTKRGCTLACDYCSYPLLEGRALRPRDPSAVIDDIQHLSADHHVPYVFFTDSVFNDTAGHYIKLVEAMARRGVSIKWTAFFRPARFPDEVIELMKSTGLTAAEMGADASTDTTLAAMHKPFRFRDVAACNEQLQQHGLGTAHYVMFGGPGETPKTVGEGIANVLSLRNTVIFAFMGIRLLPDTGLLRQALAEGVVEPEQSLLDPVYYLSPATERAWLEKTLTESFAPHRHVVFPPDRFDHGLRLLHKLGHTGMLYEKLLSPDRRASVVPRTLP